MTQLTQLWRRLLIGGGVAIGLVAVASIVPGPNAAVTARQPEAVLLASSELAPDTAATLRQACGNRHSNLTLWPWYSHVAPASWLLQQDVSEARKFMNLSRWPEYGRAGQGQLLQAAAERIRSGAMPPSRYLLLHPETRLNEPEKAELIAALARESLRLSQPVRPVD